MYSKKVNIHIQNSKIKGHLGIQKTITVFGRKFYFPGFIEFLIVYFNKCVSCLASKSPKREVVTPPLNTVSLITSFLSDLLQIDVVGQIPKSGGYSCVVTTMDVFSKYLFAQPITLPSAEGITIVLKN